MKTNARRDHIYQQILYKEVVKVGELAQELGVSTETIRRDLDAMEKDGLLEREHGLARVRREKSRAMMDVRTTLNADGKERIARKALELVEEHSTIFVDGGSTGIAFAKMLGVVPGLTLVTNGLESALACVETGHEVIMCGGKVHAGDRSSLGGDACAAIDRIALDVAFVGTDGLSGAKGPTSYFMEDCDLKRHIMARADKVVLLADAMKFDYKGTYEYATWEDLSAVISDDLVAQNRALVSAAENVYSV